jgi:D-3-phosphoglycerate dehydrogenase / 2-oxoglutarate reductase
MTARRARVVISDYDYGDVAVERAIVEGAGHELVALQCRTDEELAREAKGADAIICQYCRVGAKTIQAVASLRHIARYGVGVDIVDVAAATERGVLVTNVPHDYCLDEVADHAMALMLALTRKLRDYDRAVQDGAWRWQSGRPLYRLRGSVVGVLSFGNIGRAIAARGQAFGFEVIAHDPYVNDDVFTTMGVERVSFSDLLRRSDVLMNQAPLTDETRGRIGADELRSMKLTAYLINTGRGPTVDNHALRVALDEGRLAGAGLDDLEEEPAKRRDWTPTDSPLVGHPKVIVTPHVAYYSEASIETARTFASEEVVRVLAGRPPRTPVNAAKPRRDVPPLGQ